MTNFKNFIRTSFIQNLLKWTVISVLVGVFCGSVSALFLLSLDFATNYRENHIWIIAFLPFGGLAIGYLYHYWGEEVVKGNNLVLDEYYAPKKPISIKMVPMILISTLITHLFGGSAGREGTAVQMSASISDQFTKWLKLDNIDRKTLLIIGISGGFASVFGTPFAGVIFAFEVLVLKNIRFNAILPSIITSFVAHYTCLAWKVSHTLYSISFVAEISVENGLWAILAGIIFGLTALLFTKSTQFWISIFKTYIKKAPLRPFIGGIVIAVAVFALGNTKYIGLGIPVIESAFSQHLDSYDFLIKILFTAFTLGAGFKGGEVTPLFYIGAVLGNALVWFIPLPLPLLAGMGFVAVFSGATNTPLACIVMGIELFGIDSVFFTSIACIIAYLSSGYPSIYSSQIKEGLKFSLYRKLKIYK